MSWTCCTHSVFFFLSFPFSFQYNQLPLKGRINLSNLSLVMLRRKHLELDGGLHISSKLLQ